MWRRWSVSERFMRSAENCRGPGWPHCVIARAQGSENSHRKDVRRARCRSGIQPSRASISRSRLQDVVLVQSDGLSRDRLRANYPTRPHVADIALFFAQFDHSLTPLQSPVYAQRFSGLKSILDVTKVLLLRVCVLQLSYPPLHSPSPCAPFTAGLSVLTC